MFEYLHDRLHFWAFYRKNDIKTSILRDFLLEGAILIPLAQLLVKWLRENFVINEFKMYFHN